MKKRKRNLTINIGTLVSGPIYFDPNKVNDDRIKDMVRETLLTSINDVKVVT